MCSLSPPRGCLKPWEIISSLSSLPQTAWWLIFMSSTFLYVKPYKISSLINYKFISWTFTTLATGAEVSAVAQGPTHRDPGYSRSWRLATCFPHRYSIGTPRRRLKSYLAWTQTTFRGKNPLLWDPSLRNSLSMSFLWAAWSPRIANTSFWKHLLQ